MASGATAVSRRLSTTATPEHARRRLALLGGRQGARPPRAGRVCLMNARRMQVELVYGDGGCR